MGNNMVSSVIKVFDRSHLEIDSISAKIDREQINGCREKHEVYVENIGIFHKNVENHDGNNPNQVHRRMFRKVNLKLDETYSTSSEAKAVILGCYRPSLGTEIGRIAVYRRRE